MFNQIIQGNHLDVLKRYPDDCFDMFLTSPPYDNLRDYEGYDFQLEPLAHELYRTLKPGGVGVWVVNDATVNGSETLTTAKQKIYFREECGFNIHDTMIYYRFSPYPSNVRYWQAFEYMVILSKGKPLTFNPLKESRNVESKKRRFYRENNSRFRQKDGSLGLSDEKARHRLTHRDIEQRIKTNVWEILSGYCQGTTDFFAHKHPAIFPEKLAEDHILSWSNPDDVVLDPMCGSGTTCKMTVKHRRQFVGIDIAEEYCELARKRLDRFTQQTTIFETLDNKRNGADFEPAATFEE